MIIREESGLVYDLNKSLLKEEPEWDRKLFGINFINSIVTDLNDSSKICDIKDLKLSEYRLRFNDLEVNLKIKEIELQKVRYSAEDHGSDIIKDNLDGENFY